MLELSVVIFSLILLATILLVGASAWKKGSDRAMCVGNLAGVQKAVRGYANMSGLQPGETVTGLEMRVIGPDRFFDQLPACPGGGDYTLGGDQVPAIGSLYMNCSLATASAHEPKQFSDW